MDTSAYIMSPWTKSLIRKDFAGMSTNELERYTVLMDEDIREQLHNAIAPCSPTEFMLAYIDRVGPEEAGRIILGS